jgi:para-nitrobenzyl esterase
MFTGHAIAQAEMAVKGSGQVFMYRFDWNCPAFGGMYAPHEGEVPLVFGNVDYTGDLWEPGGNDSPATRAAADPDGRRYRVSDTMIRMWSEFARNGDPSTPTLPWPAYTLERRQTMLIDANPEVVDDPDAGMRRQFV